MGFVPKARNAPVIVHARLALALLWLATLLPERPRLWLIRYTARMLARNGRAFGLFDDKGQPYLIRYLIRTEYAPDEHGTWKLKTGPAHMIALHNIQQGDADRWEHNHPWIESEAKILHGGYWEQRAFACDDRTWRPSPQKRRSRETNRLDSHLYHRIVRVFGDTWTLFRTGEKTKDGWGFLIDGAHVPWKDANLSIGDWVQVDETGMPVDHATRIDIQIKRILARYKYKPANDRLVTGIDVGSDGRCTTATVQRHPDGTMTVVDVQHDVDLSELERDAQDERCKSYWKRRFGK